MLIQTDQIFNFSIKCYSVGMSLNLGFWGKLTKPTMVLAPMADVTDAAFRRIIAKYSKWGGCDVGDEEARSHFAQEGYAGQVVMWTEFVSADGLCHPKGREKLLVDLKYTESERPIVAQLFTSKPEKMFEASKLVTELGFDGLDINMGCPDRAVERQGCGAALIKNPALARELIRAAKEGAGGDRGIPVSVKTRIGYNKNELATWLPELLAENPAVITIHARTRKEMSDVPARWEHVKEAVQIHDSLKSQTLIFGNGDIVDVADAKRKCEETGADGAMLGRAIFGNPFLFLNKNAPISSSEQFLFGDSLREVSASQRLKVMLEHTKLFSELFSGIKHFAVMKKHFKAYVNGLDGAKELRMELMETESAEDVEKIVNRYLESHKN